MSASKTDDGLVCFTNCLLPQEDGSLLNKDLWIDERTGLILDPQLTFFDRKERPSKVIDLGGNILSPGFLDIQINGAYGFDFSVYPPPVDNASDHIDGDKAFRDGLHMVAERIVETGVTAILPTIITQEKSLYPKLLELLAPYTPTSSTTSLTPTGAHLLGWHAEGPFIQPLKRGAHAQSFLLTAPSGFLDLSEVYGNNNLRTAESQDDGKKDDTTGVRIITLAPEVDGVMNCVSELTKRGIIVSIGHSMASTNFAAEAVSHGARLITHLFNAMPQLHHRDPGIIGLLGASPAASLGNKEDEPAFSTQEQSPKDNTGRHSATLPTLASSASTSNVRVESEALNELDTPPQTPVFGAQPDNVKPLSSWRTETLPLSPQFERPFYGLIVDGIHSHPNSVRLAYTAHKDGCVLITDAMKMFDPHMLDGPHEWRDGKRLIKEGVRLYIEGTDTLAGSVVTMDICVRNFVRFTGCSIGEAIKCATYNPAKCLKIEHKKGTLRPGADADLVLLDRDDGTVLETWVSGKLVYKDRQ